MVLWCPGLSNSSGIEGGDSLPSGSPSRVCIRCASADAALDCSRRVGRAAGYAVRGRLLRHAVIHEPQTLGHSRSRGRQGQAASPGPTARDEHSQPNLAITPRLDDGGSNSLYTRNQVVRLRETRAKGKVADSRMKQSGRLIHT